MSVPRTPRRIPEWMEPMPHYFENTGGTPVEELINLKAEDTRGNYILAALAVAASSQVMLLERLKANGWLREDWERISKGQGW